MRTLKKTLCLVLALVMMLGVCAFSVSAKFNDDAQITYKEAVSVLNGIGVINGKGNDNFDPNGTLNRAEAATILAKLMGGDGITAKSTFTDIGTFTWAESYIAFCQAKGVIGGYGDGTFGPGNALTGSQWGRMLLLAAGFDAASLGIESGNANWEINVAKAVKDKKLAANIAGFNGTQNISRDAACELAFQAMQLGVSGAAYYTVDGYPKAQFDSWFEAYVFAKEEGLGAADVTTSIPDDSLAATYFGSLDHTLDNPADLFGRELSGWSYGTGVNRKAIYVEAEEALATVDSGSFKATVAPYKSWTLADDATILYNGGDDATFSSAKTIADLAKAPRPGVTYEFYGSTVNGKVVIDKVIASEYYLAEITGISSKGNIELTVYEAGKGTAVKVPVNAPVGDADPSYNYIVLSGFAKGDVLAVHLMPGWDVVSQCLVIDAVKADTVTGRVTAFAADAKYNGTLTINGTKYTFANEYSQTAVGRGSEGTFYLSPDGFVLGFKGDVVDNSSVVYAVARYTKMEANNYGGSETFWVQAVNMDGNEAQYQVSEEQYKKLSNSINALMVVSADMANPGCYTLEAAKTDSDKGITVVEGQKRTLSTKSVRFASSADGKTLTNEYLASDVKFIYVDKELGALDITIRSGAQDLEDRVVSFVANAVPGSSNTTVSVVFVKSAYAPAAAATSQIVFVPGTEIEPVVETYATNAAGKTVEVNGFVVYVDGEETTIYCDATVKKIAGGFHTLSLDGEVAVLGDASKLTNLIPNVVVEDMFNGLLTTSKNEKVDVPVAGAEFVNVSDPATATVTDATGMIKGDEAALVCDADGSILIIYLTKEAERKAD